MSVIAAFFIRKIIQQAELEGIHAGSLLGEAGIERDQLEADIPVDEQRHYRLWELIMGQLGKAAVGFPLRYAQTMSVDDYGLLGLSWKTAPHMLGALKRTARYHQVLTDTSVLETEKISCGARIHFRRSGERTLGLRVANEAALAEVLHAVRTLYGHEKPRPADVACQSIHFQHPAPASTSQHQAWFGCSVFWNAAFDAIDLPQETLDLVPRRADEGLSVLVLERLDHDLANQAAQRRGEPESVQMRVTQTVLDALPEGVPKMTQVARRLGMRPRTLHRRLEQSGASYKELVQTARRARAEDLLRTAGHPLGEVAFMTGFSEPSSFHRAFKRWTGRTPADFRQNPAQ